MDGMAGIRKQANAQRQNCLLLCLPLPMGPNGAAALVRFFFSRSAAGVSTGRASCIVGRASWMMCSAAVRRPSRRLVSYPHPHPHTHKLVSPLSHALSRQVEPFRQTSPPPGARGITTGPFSTSLHPRRAMGGRRELRTETNCVSFCEDNATCSMIPPSRM